MINLLNKRMQSYYEEPAKHRLTRRTPVIVRVDGRAFHTFTRNFQKPFDQRLIDAMIVSATEVVGEMQGFKLAYVQSDEASFVMTDYDTLLTDPWFGYVKSKVETITASIMTAAFARCMRLANITQPAHFDARAFNIPADDVANYFLGRAKDWHCNSVSMYARTFFTNMELMDKRINDVHVMLHGIGHNWSTDLSDEEKNGSFLIGCESRSDVEPNYPSIAALWEESCEESCATTKNQNHDTSSEPVENENDLESNITPIGSRNGARGNGIQPRSDVTKP